MSRISKAQEREAWEWGVVAASAVAMARARTEGDRDRIMAETMGLLHGTMGPVPERKKPDDR